MKSYYQFKGDVAAFVNDWLLRFPKDLPSTMTITQEKSGDYSVQTVIDTSSEDTDYQTARFFSETQVNT